VRDRRLQLPRSDDPPRPGDSQFLTEAGKIGLDISPISGEKLQQIVEKLYSTPKSVLEQARRAIHP
jgi:hypothetical protein